MERPRKQSKPRKILFVEHIDQLLKLTEAQMKVWLYHYRREGGGEERKSWAKRDTITSATGFSRPTISHARTWLVQNGWLRIVGYRPTPHGGHAIREYRCCFPPKQQETQPFTSSTQQVQCNPNDTSTGEQGKTGDTMQGKTSDTSKGKPAAHNEVDSREVTATPIPEEVFRPTNSDGKKERTEENNSAPSEPDESSLSLEKLLSRSLPDKDLNSLAWLMRKVWRKDLWDGEEWYAEQVMVDARSVGFNPMAMLLHNRSHKKGGLYLRSFAQWYGALNSETMRVMEDYLACRDNPCEVCIKNKHEQWITKYPFVGVDAIHCSCPGPNPLAHNYTCRTCLMMNNKGVLEPSEAKLKQEWEQAEAIRLAKLAKFNFANPTEEEIAAFKKLVSPDWPTGRIKEMLDKNAGKVSAVWTRRSVNAAYNKFLQYPDRLGLDWEEFKAAVEHVGFMDIETPMPEPKAKAASADFEIEEL
jgi:hypothetical protein